VNKKLEIKVTTINSETLHKINYSFASEARLQISDSRRHLSQAAQYPRRLKSQICPHLPSLRPLGGCEVQMINSKLCKALCSLSSLNEEGGKSQKLEREAQICGSLSKSSLATTSDGIQINCSATRQCCSALPR
jgi:hypothetical protein